MQNPNLRTKLNLLKEEVLEKNQNKKRDFDKSKVQCYNCEKFGHFADECWFKKDQKIEEANIAHEGDPDAVLLMAATCEDRMKGEEWYLDSGCSNHMTGHREWLANFDASKKTSIKLADNRKLASEGSGNIVMRSNFGDKVIIEDVFYVPDMKCNLMSIGQLVEKGFSVSMEGDSLKLFDQKKNLVLKSTLSKNRTYRCNISSDKMLCMSATISEDVKALWHSYICGPFEVPSLGGSKYFISFIDEFTRMI